MKVKTPDYSQMTEMPTMEFVRQDGSKVIGRGYMLPGTEEDAKKTREALAKILLQWNRERKVLMEKAQ